MSEYTREEYQLDCIKFKKDLAGERIYDFIVRTYYPDLKGDDRRKVKMDIVNVLNGNSFSKAIEMNIRPILKKVYKNKTGKAFK